MTEAERSALADRLGSGVVDDGEIGRELEARILADPDPQDYLHFVAAGSWIVSADFLQKLHEQTLRSHVRERIKYNLKAPLAIFGQAEFGYTGADEYDAYARRHDRPELGRAMRAFRGDLMTPLAEVFRWAAAAKR